MKMVGFDFAVLHDAVSTCFDRASTRSPWSLTRVCFFLFRIFPVVCLNEYLAGLKSIISRGQPSKGRKLITSFTVLRV